MWCVWLKKLKKKIVDSSLYRGQTVAKFVCFFVRRASADKVSSLKIPIAMSRFNMTNVTSSISALSFLNKNG